MEGSLYCVAVTMNNVVLINAASCGMSGRLTHKIGSHGLVDYRNELNVHRSQRCATLRNGSLNIECRSSKLREAC